MTKSPVFILVAALAATVSETNAFVSPPRPSTSTTTTSQLASSFRPSSKPQDKVAIDPKTGLYRPIKKVPRLDREEDGRSSTWDDVKEAVYKGVDGLSGIRLPSKDSKKEDTGAGVVGGYSDVEREFETAANGSNRTPLSMVGKASTPVDKILQSKTKELKNNDKEEEPLIPPTPLEKAKEFIWGSVDAVKSQSTRANANRASTNPTTLDSALESFQPAVRARMVMASEEFLQALTDLESPNPVVRLAAGRKIKALAASEQRQLERDRPNPLTAVKESFWTAADAVQSTRRKIVQWPDKAKQTYQTTVHRVDQTVQAAKQVPSRVRSGIDKTVDTTQTTVKTVRELPTRIQNTVSETNQNVRRTVRQTRQGAQNVRQTVDDVTTQSKVLLGLEKPKPRPPTTPPPEPLTPQQATWKILSASGSLVGRVGWFVGKNTAKLAWKATSVAASKGGETLSAKVQEYQERQKQRPSQSTVPPPALNVTTAATTTTADTRKPVETPRPTSIATAQKEVDDDGGDEKEEDDEFVAGLAAKEARQNREMTELEMEIEEALRLADAAIQSAQAEIEESQRKTVNKPKTNRSSDGDDEEHGDENKDSA